MRQEKSQKHLQEIASLANNLENLHAVAGPQSQTIETRLGGRGSFPAETRRLRPARTRTHLEGPATDPSRHGPFSAHVPLPAAGPAAPSSRPGDHSWASPISAASRHTGHPQPFALGERGRNSKEKEPWGQSQDTSSQCGRAGATWQAPGRSGPELGSGSRPRPTIARAHLFK